MPSKGVVSSSEYTFDKTAKTITFTKCYSGLALSDVMYIINVKSGTATVIYDPSDAAKGGTLSGLVLTLAYDTSAMANSDPLQIIIGKSDLKQTVSVDDLAFMFKRMMEYLARPPYMDGVSQVRVVAGNTLGAVTINGSLTTLTTLTTLNQLGAGAIDQTFTYFTQNRDVFNNLKNRIIT